MLHQLQLVGLHLRYADPAAPAADDWQAASALISHAAPEMRLAAVQLLAELCRAAAPPHQTSAVASDKCAAAAVAAGQNGSVAAVACSEVVAGSTLSTVQQARVDAAFLSLCSAVSTDTVAAIRLEALLALAGGRHSQQLLYCIKNVCCTCNCT